MFHFFMYFFIHLIHFFLHFFSFFPFLFNSIFFFCFFFSLLFIFFLRLQNQLKKNLHWYISWFLKMTRTIHYCNFCDYKSDRRYDRDKHVSRKHGIHSSTPTQTGSGAGTIKQTIPQGKYSNLHSHKIILDL